MIAPEFDQPDILAPLPMPEAPAEPSPEPSRLRRVLIAVGLAGTVALASACSAENHPVPAPTDTRPAVVDLGQYAQYPEQTYIDTTSFTVAVQNAVQAQQMPDYASFGLNANTDLPVDDSAPLFNVLLGNDGKLRVQDETNGAVDMQSSDAQALFGAVEADSTLLTGVMRAHKLHELRVRIFKQDSPGADPTLTPHSYGEYLAKDPTDHGQNNIYEYLPAVETLDQLSVSTLLQHETIHAALQQGLEAGKLSAADIATMGQACSSLRDVALQESQAFYGDTIDRLTYLRSHIDKRYSHAFTRVIDALQNNTYDQLPQPPQASEVPECLVQTPIQAVNGILMAEGVNTDPLDKQLFEGEAGDVAATLADDWQQMIIQDTIYRYLREAAYVPETADNDLFGHPYNNSDETTVTFADIAFKFPAQVADNLIDTPPEAQKATDTIVAFTANHLKQLYANDPAIVNWVNQRYQAYQAARHQ